MSSTIGSLAIEVVADSSQFKSDLGKAAQVAQQSAREMQQSAYQVEKGLRQQEAAARALIARMREEYAVTQQATAGNAELTASLSASQRAAQQMQAQLDQLDSALKNVRQSSNRADILSSTKGSLNNLQEQQRFLQSLEREASTVGKTRSELAAMRAVQLGLANDAAPLINKLRESEEALEHVGHSSSGVRRELIVLAHEMATGNYSRFGGSMLVIGERMDILSKIMSPLGLGITAVIGVVATLGTLMAKGALESERLANSLQLTGNYAGITEGQLDAMARNVSADLDQTISSSKEILATLASSGSFTRDELQGSAEVISKIATLTQGDAQKIAQEFEQMGDDVAGFAEKHIRDFGSITASQIEYIRQLQETRGATAAMIQYNADLNASLGNVTANLGIVERGWNAVKRAMSSVANDVGDWGKATTVDSKIANIKQQLDEINNSPFKGSLQPQAQQLGAMLPALEAQKAQQDAAAQAQSEERQRQVNLVSADAYLRKMRETYATNLEKRNKEIAEYNKQADILAAAGKITPEQRQSDIAHINAKYETKGADSSHADLSLSLKPLQDSIEAEQRLYTEREQELAKQFKNDEISSAAYFSQKRAALDADVAHVQQAYAREIQIVQAAEAKAKDARTSAELQRQLVDLQDKSTAALRDAAAQRNQITEEETAEAEKYRKEVDRLRLTLLELKGDTVQAATIKFDDSNASLKRQATNNGDTGTLDQLNQVRDLTVAQAQLNQLNEQAALIESQLQLAEQHVNLESQLGVTNSLQSAVKLQQIRTDAANQLSAIATQYQAIAQASGDPKMLQSADQFRLKIDELSASANVLGQKLQNAFQTTFGNSLSEFIQGTKSASQAFGDFTKNIEKQIADLVSQDIAKRLFSSIFGGAPSGAGGGASISGIGSLATFFGSFFSSGSGSSAVTDSSTYDDELTALFATGAGLAGGGPAQPNTLHQVAERGPELYSYANKTYLLTGSEGGFVTPNSQLGTGGTNGPVVHQHFTVMAPEGRISRQTDLQMRQTAGMAVQMANARNG